MPKFAANLTLLFNEAPFLERFALAAKAGFKGVEYLFPYAWSSQTLKTQLVTHQLQQVLFNLPPGDWDNGDRGIACIPSRQQEFQQGVQQAIEYAQVLDCKQINCLAGLKPDNISDEEAYNTLLNNVQYAANSLKKHDITLMLEAINSKLDMPGFFLDRTSKVLQLIKDAGCDNIQYQYDIYHMQIMEGNILRTIEQSLSQIGHIQFADNPGRHEPGTGELNLPGIFSHLDKIQYRGWISAEYRPETDTEKSLNWLKGYSP